MTQQLGNSLEIQGKESRFSPEFHLISETSAVTDYPVKLKRKRGRPRKALPMNILPINRSRTDRADCPHVEPSPKKLIAKQNRYFKKSDSNFSDNPSPFPEEELITLDEFERLKHSSSEWSQNHSDDFNRVDLPAPPVLLPRKKAVRRRQIDPSTCERDYSRDEVEFMNALDEYKRSSGRMFPTCSEILEVLKNLGYEKRSEFV
jgi:hypothetical protein